MKKLIIFSLFLLMAVWGCSTKENPATPTVPSGTLVSGFINSTSIGPNWIDEAPGRQVYVYEPAGYQVGLVDSIKVYIDSSQGDSYHYDTTFIDFNVASAEYPTLYLLHGYGGNYKYYQYLYLVKDILDEMISTGEIIPMVVVTPDCDNVYGGSFYTDSPQDPPGSDTTFTGDFESFIVADLIQYMDDNFNVDSLASGRGISGHSMGGYGAMKLALKHPELYNSVSAMSAPLVFDSLALLLPAVYAENSFTANDTAAFYAIAPSADKRITSMMFAMGAAFTPHNLIDPDTTYFHRLLDVSEFFGVDLPFNIAGELAVESTVWQTWLENDPLTMMVSGGYAASLEGKAVYLDCAVHDDLGLIRHAAAFDQALTNLGITHTYVPYTGYLGDEAGHINFIADRLRAVFKFHSDAFSQAE